MRRSHLILLGWPFFVGTAFAAGLGSCSDTSPSGAASSSGSASSGGGVDAGDAGDAADHGDVTDAPVEAAGEAGWVPVSWKAPCTVEVALHPELAVPKLTWEPCPGSSPGCEGIAVNWSKGVGPPLAAPTVTPWGDGYRVGVYFNYVDSELRTAVFGEDGVPLVAWRAPTSCLLIVPRVGPENVWFGAQLVDPMGGVSSVYTVAPYDKIASTNQTIPVTLAEQDIDSNDTTLALEGFTGTTTTLYDDVAHQAKTFGAPPGLGFMLAHPVNDSAFMLFFSAFEKPEAWIWNRSTHAVAPLIQPSPEVVMDVRSDGSTIAWLQVPPKKQSDSYFPPGDLWTSPFATSMAGLKPTKRRAIGMIGEVTGAAGQGFYAMYGATEDRKIHVYRLSDAQHWEFVPPAETYGIREISYVDPKYVWYWTETGVYRQALDVLGPGDPAP